MLLIHNAKHIFTLLAQDESEPSPMSSLVNIKKRHRFLNRVARDALQTTYVVKEETQGSFRRVSQYP